MAYISGPVGDQQAAADVAKDALALATRIGSAENLIWARGNQLSPLFELGRWTEFIRAWNLGLVEFLYRRDGSVFFADGSRLGPEHVDRFLAASPELLNVQVHVHRAPSGDLV